MYQQPVLSICIPTYNRAGYLSKCLNSICQQLEGISSDIELVISDNASVDETGQVVERFIADGFDIRYFRNQSNMGFDFNFRNCVRNANGKYVWLFGDDDIMLPQSLNKLIGLLKSDDYGVLYLNALSFDSEENLKFDTVNELEYTTYNNAIDYYSKVNYLTTFITGNIFNKSCLKDTELTNIQNSNLIQVAWIVPAIFSGKPNIYISTPVVAAKSGNTGGYKLITTFAKNYNLILHELVRRGVDKRVIEITNNALLSGFFPQFLGTVLYDKHSFENENGFNIMFSHYWSYYKFWRNIAPRYAKFFLKRALK
jgi:abequosyltransferase